MIVHDFGHKLIALIILLCMKMNTLLLGTYVLVDIKSLFFLNLNL